MATLIKGANIHNDLNSLLNLLQSKKLSNAPNVRVWKFQRNGIFTTNSLYDILSGIEKRIIVVDGFGLLNIL